MIPEYTKARTALNEQVQWRTRLKAAREQSRKTPVDLAHTAGISVPAYYDLENCNGDLSATISIAQLRCLCAALDISPVSLLSERNASPTTTPPEHLRAAVLDYMRKENIDIAEFERRTGYAIEPFLAECSVFSGWNIDYLRSVCYVIGIDWTHFL